MSHSSDTIDAYDPPLTHSELVSLAQDWGIDAKKHGVISCHFFTTLKLLEILRAEEKTRMLEQDVNTRALGS